MSEFSFLDAQYRSRQYDIGQLNWGRIRAEQELIDAVMHAQHRPSFVVGSCVPRRTLRWILL